MLFLLAIALFLNPGVPPTRAGTEPVQNLGARDLRADYHLPPLKDQPGDPLYLSIQQTQVLSRARRLNLKAYSSTEAWMEAGANYARARKALATPNLGGEKLFHGSRASELNRILGQPGPCVVRVDSSSIRLDTRSTCRTTVASTSDTLPCMA